MTNIPTPYRAPLWQCLGQRHDLNVALLADSERARNWHVDLSSASHRVTRLHARRLGRNADSTFYAPSAMLLRLILRRPDVVVMDGWESPAYLAARWTARRLGVPVIASYRSTSGTHRHHRGPVAALRRWFFSGVNAVVTAGRASTAAVRALHVPHERITEGFNTVDVARFERALGRRPGAPESGHRFLYVGQFIERKNLAATIRAFAAVRAPGDTLTLIGDGPDRAALVDLARGLLLNGAVAFPGSLDGDALVDAYARHDTLVLPSTEEVWGLVVNEALAAGLHAVVTRACGVAAELEGTPGFFTCEPDDGSLADAMLRSRRAWTGPIPDHPATAHTPDRLADIFELTIRRVSPIEAQRRDSTLEP